MEQKNQNIKLVGLLAVLVFSLFTLRIAQLSIYKTSNGQDLTSYSETIQERSSITQARRGTIFDKNGQPIAMDTTSYSLFAILRNADEKMIVKDYDYTAKELSKYIDLSRDELLHLLLNPDVDQIEFGLAGKNLSREVKEQIEAANLPGIFLYSETIRQYINDVYSSHLIGFATPLLSDTEFGEAEILSGQIGIEAAFNEQLSGAKNYQGQQKQDYLLGEDIYLTLDSRLQNHLEDLLTDAQTIYQPKEMGAYLVELPTGKLLAASQRPTFNLNTRDGIDKEWRNLLVEEAFEPGSTVKILTMSLAYDNKIFNDKEKFHSGSIEVYDKIIKDHNVVGWGDIPFAEALPRSSNTGMVTLAKRLGDEKWVELLGKFRFGTSTASQLNNENEGKFTFDGAVSRYMSSFGQAFLATPMQLLQAYSSVGNNGTMVKVQYIEGAGNQKEQYKTINLGSPISKAAANYVLGLMVDTVEKDYGTAKAFKTPLVEVAAKTGTAEIANEAGTGYLTGENDYLHSVVAFFPAEKPQYMMYLFMKQPTNTNGLIGSQILAKIFHPFLEKILVNQ
ncbi:MULTISPECIES: penicillin-binding protein 2 [unclassified Facklamia]|uniref:peptidoglycan D,D-transpeptidase FtsI family protein n=1 Tax=Aerococcaceae TaxID=186827 RepID=UPI0013B7A36F|nr:MULTISPECIES: penicillin-binding protein 2 [unclassified Facklamia]NEW65232.1 penicillin-binding protein 2 [Facklamia sp. 252]NEW65347.1 penicillin-binding protein 2 [Facklamia sp. 252]NEW68367.1 penicillin-binding protein 2 [Facklamia sp. 253]QQD66185.1 penicillin-binding protein 2 [Aerococcaceae bacterium zg-252]